MSDFGQISRTAGAMPVWGQNTKINNNSKPQPHISFADHSFDVKNDYTTRLEITQEDILSGFEAQKPKSNGAALVGGVLDIVNPLQHIPVVSSVYRKVTGDELNPIARIAGGGLYGGVMGAASATANAMIEVQTGKDIGGHVMTAFAGDNAEATDKAAAGFDEVIEMAELPRSRRSYSHNSQQRYNG